MLVSYSLDYSYLSADKWIAVDVFGVKLHDERGRKISNETLTCLGICFLLFPVCVQRYNSVSGKNQVICSFNFV